MKYVYPAVFSPEETGGFCVYFPDIPMGATQGESLVECMDAAGKFLGDALCFIEDEQKFLPEPSALSAIERSEKDIATLVFVDTTLFRNQSEIKSA